MGQESSTVPGPKAPAIQPTLLRSRPSVFVPRRPPCGDPGHIVPDYGTNRPTCQHAASALPEFFQAAPNRVFRSLLATCPFGAEKIRHKWSPLTQYSSTNSEFLEEGDSGTVECWSDGAMDWWNVGMTGSDSWDDCRIRSPSDCQLRWWRECSVTSTMIPSLQYSIIPSFRCSDATPPPPGLPHAASSAGGC